MVSNVEILKSYCPHPKHRKSTIHNVYYFGRTLNSPVYTHLHHTTIPRHADTHTDPYTTPGNPFGKAKGIGFGSLETSSDFTFSEKLGSPSTVPRLSLLWETR